MGGLALDRPIECQPAEAFSDPAGCSSVRVYSGGDFRGSGIVIARDVVLTCAHVICPEWSEEGGWPQGMPSMSLHVRVNSGAAVTVTQLLREHEFCDRHGHDWVALRTATPVCMEPSVLVVHVRSEWLERFTGQLEVEGFQYALRSGAARGLPLKGRPWTESDRVVRGQVDGALGEGVSGAPLSVRLRVGRAVVGMLVLGGRGKGQSDFIGSDLLVELARREGLRPRVIDARSARPAFSPRWLGPVRLGAVGALALALHGDASASIPTALAPVEPTSNSPVPVAPTVGPTSAPQPSEAPVPVATSEPLVPGRKPHGRRTPAPPKPPPAPVDDPCVGWSKETYEETLQNDPCNNFKP